MKKQFQDAFFDYFMPLIILYRYFTATKDAKVISIERPLQNSPPKNSDLSTPEKHH